MRKSLLSVVMLFVVLSVVVPASAGTIIPGLSFPLLEERPTTITAGINQLVTFSGMPLGEVTCFYKNGFLLVPKDRFGIFDDLAYVRIDPVILNIDPKFLKEVMSKVTNAAVSADSLSTDGNSVIVCIKALGPGLYVMATAATHDASRVDRRGLLATLGQLVGIKKHNQVLSTDRVAATFGVIDADDFILMFSDSMFGVSDPTKLNVDQKRLLRSAFFEQELRGTIQPARPLPAYSLLADAYSRKVQGYPGAFAPQGPSAIERQLEALAKENAELRQQLANSQQATRPAAPFAVAELKTESEVQISWVEQLRLDYAGKTGFLLVSVGRDGCRSYKPLVFNFYQKLSDGSWKRNATNPMSLDSKGVGKWFFTGSCSWKGFGLTMGSGVPGETYTIHQSGLRIIAVPDDGSETYEIE